MHAADRAEAQKLHSLGCSTPDFRVMGDQHELLGPVASVPTRWRALNEIASGGSRALTGGHRGGERGPAAGVRHPSNGLVLGHPGRAGCHGQPLHPSPPAVGRLTCARREGW
jgi:hypothetical protein